jgi:hypothetical protein
MQSIRNALFGCALAAGAPSVIAYSDASANALYARSAAMAHPRSLRDAAGLHDSEKLRPVDRQLGGALLPEAQALEEATRTVAVLRAYAATAALEYFDDALRRARHIATWNPRGRTDEDSRSVAWALALAYDQLAPRLDNTQKTQLLAPLRERTNELINVVTPDGRPTLLAIATLLAGDVPESKLWLVKLGREAS